MLYMHSHYGWGFFTARVVPCPLLPGAINLGYSLAVGGHVNG